MSVGFDLQDNVSKMCSNTKNCGKYLFVSYICSNNLDNTIFPVRLVLPHITLPGTLALGPRAAVLIDHNTVAKYRRCGSTRKYYVGAYEPIHDK